MTLRHNPNTGPNTQPETEPAAPPHVSPIILAAGGSGGHVFPAIAFAEYARSKNHPVVLMTDQRGGRFIQKDAHLFEHIEILPTPKWSTVFALYRSIRNIYTQWHPKTALGFGGMMTVAPLLMAKRFKMPCAVHQSDAIIGKANQFLSYFMDKIFLGHPLDRYGAVLSQTKPLNWFHIGTPTRRAFHAIPPHTVIPPALHILILGGSQGAKIWSDILPNALACLPKSTQNALHIRHQCSQNDHDALIQGYQGLSLGSFHVTPFFSNMPETLTWAHVVFSRAGASTLAELSQTHRAAFLVPYPHAARNHQHANAVSYAENHTAWVQDQSTLTPDHVATLIQRWMDKPEELLYSGKQTKTHLNLDACSPLYDFCSNP